jgi:hypothetical protein
MNRIPRSPFATRLSGSPGETRLRMYSIFRWRKGRPPVWLVALTALVLLACGLLVSCRADPAVFPQVTMAVQYYDSQGNFIEIPTLTPPGGGEGDAGVQAINQALAQLEAEYQPVLSGDVLPEDSAAWYDNRCLLYPTQTDRYLNLLFFRSRFTTDLNTGHVLSLVYDGRTGEQVSLEQALELAGVTREELYADLAEHYEAQFAQEYPELDLRIHSPALEGFRMGADGAPLFYLTARVDDADDAVQDGVSGADNLYVWAQGTFSLYDQYALQPQPLVPPEETLDLQPSLWCRWSAEGGQPEDGLASVPAQAQALILDYYAQNYQPTRLYLAEEQPDTPQQGDLRVDAIAWAGEALLYETMGVAYTVTVSWYESANGTLAWREPGTGYLVLSRGNDGSYQQVLGAPSFHTEGMAVEDIIHQTAWHLSHLEVCLWRDGYPTPIGPGNWTDLFRPAYDGEPVVEEAQLEPIYHPGDSYQWWSVDGFSALRYYSAQEDRFLLRQADVTRDDLYTPRGIRVGDTRAQVLAAYPEALTGDYWGLYPGEDMLSYVAYSTHDPAQVQDLSQLDFYEGLGPAILFFFQGDTLRQITLTSMDN